MGFYSDILRVSLSVAAASTMIACGSAKKHGDAESAAPHESAKQQAAETSAAEKTEAAPGEVEQLRTQVTELKTKLEDMEMRLTSLSEKVNFAQTGMEQVLRGGTAV